MSPYCTAEGKSKRDHAHPQALRRLGSVPTTYPGIRGLPSGYPHARKYRWGMFFNLSTWPFVK
jgi:hypothetical protein